MNRFFAVVPLACWLLLPGCSELSDRYGLYQEPPSAWTIEQNNNRLSTIEKLVQTGKSSAAKQQADLVNLSELTAQQTAKMNLLSAQILLSFGEAEQALSKLAATDTGQLDIFDQTRYFQSQAFAYSLTGNLFESAKARIALDGLLTNPNERKKNQAIILEGLGLLPEALAQKPQNRIQGLPQWMAIAKILAMRNQDPSHFNSALASWRAANPQHPANIYLSNVSNRREDVGDMPSSIAVFLPESGPFADAGKAVKAGFMAAHSRDNRSVKPVLHFYDTEKAKPAALYQQAINDGAKLVIGPLNKENIQSLANSVSLSIPVLALNYVPDLNKVNLYQFAISPMDDVADVTQKAALDGRKKALLLMPNNEQGKRVGSFFANSWQALNGSIVEKQEYNPKATDFSTTVKKLLNLDESESRYKKILGFFPSAHYAPRKRQDADALFLSAYNSEGRSIISQLQSQRSGNLPIYAMPTIYSGVTDAMGDNVLNGVTFCDMPWLFDAAYGGDLGMMALKNIWSQFPSTYLRLPAMGIDAYHLAGGLTNLGSAPFSGATGNLTLTGGNRIKRNLVCAKFAAGQPGLIGFNHSPNESGNGN